MAADGRGRGRVSRSISEARLGAASPALPPPVGSNPHGQTQGCGFHSPKQERKCLCRHASQLGNSFHIPFNPFWGSRASFGSPSVSFLCLSPAPVPLPLLLSPPASSVGWGTGMRSSWLLSGGPFIQACGQHPAPSTRTRYLIKPGIPRGCEKPAGRQPALSPHPVLTSAVIIPCRWQAEAGSLSFSPPSSQHRGT